MEKYYRGYLIDTRSNRLVVTRCGVVVYRLDNPRSTENLLESAKRQIDKMLDSPSVSY